MGEDHLFVGQGFDQKIDLRSGEMAFHALRSVFVPTRTIGAFFWGFHEFEGLNVRFFQKRTYCSNLSRSISGLKTDCQGNSSHAR